MLTRKSGNMQVKKILVTGHLGYIGVHLVDLLKAAGYIVIGCDLGLFKGCEWETFTKADCEIHADFRSLRSEQLKEIDAVMHLAAISNDPMGDLDPTITYAINRDGTIDLAKKAKAAGVPLFLFASSCSIYGKGGEFDVDESGEVAPITPYAHSKIDAEEALKDLSNEDFKTISLRNATAYGHSPMLRIDLVVNNLLACALSRGDIRVMSDGSPWRPLIHCRDIAKAFVAFLETPPKEFNTIVNVGGNRENYQVKAIVEKLQMRLPHTKVIFTGEVGADPRNYRVNFNKLSKLLPNFKLSYTIDKGIEELLSKYQTHKFTEADFLGDRFVRLRTLKKRMDLITHAF